MIGFLRGVLFEKGSGYIIIDVGGIGYEVSVPANSGAYLSSEGEEVMIYTTMIVREDDVSLYGFSRRGELDAFRKLITVNGVGAKAGISILSAFTLEQLHQAIVFEDVKALTKANGIGKKTAERIVLERKLNHGGHPVLRWNMDNAFVRTDPAGNLKIDKEKSTEKVDGAVALVMALDRAMKNQGGESVYDTRGLLII